MYLVWVSQTINQIKCFTILLDTYLRIKISLKALSCQIILFLKLSSSKYTTNSDQAKEWWTTFRREHKILPSLAERIHTLQEQLQAIQPILPRIHRKMESIHLTHQFSDHKHPLAPLHLSTSSLSKLWILRMTNSRYICLSPSSNLHSHHLLPKNNNLSHWTRKFHFKEETQLLLWSRQRFKIHSQSKTNKIFWVQSRTKSSLKT